MITLSIVSHRQGDLVQCLLDDIEVFDSPLIERIVITLNIAEAWRPANPALEPKLMVVQNDHPQGYGANHNAAFNACTTEYFAVMNPDLRLPRDPLPALLRTFESNSRLGLASPAIIGPDGTPQDAVRQLITPFAVLARKLGADKSHRSPRQPAWIAGMFMLFRAEAFRSLGGFDPRYFMYCEDFDICARLRLAGWTFESTDSATVIHDARRSTLKSPRHLSWHLSSFLKMWTSPVFWRYRRQLKEGAENASG